MQHSPVFPTWSALLEAPHSPFFRGHTRDTLYDRSTTGRLMPSSESMFTQSNARVLLGQAANGSLRMVAMPTTPAYPAPTGSRELGLGPGMYHHFDVAMYVGDLAYAIELAGGGNVVELAADERDNETWYADDFLPLTRTRVGDLEIALISCAPVAPDARAAALAPAPLPGPAGALYVLHLRNTGAQAVAGKVVLRASDLLIGNYEDGRGPKRVAPAAHIRQETVILSRPDGVVGIHLHDGRWRTLEAPFVAERPFVLPPGAELVVETHLALGAQVMEVMPTIYALHLLDALDWVNRTADFWRSRLGQLVVDSDFGSEHAQVSRDVFVRSLLDNFNCLQTDQNGVLYSHWQGAPSHGYGTVWGIDVEPTAVSIVHVCPELARQVLLFFLDRCRVPRGPLDHSVPILVAPFIIARQWLAVSHDVAFLRNTPQVMVALETLMADLISLRAPSESLFPSRFSSDGPVGRRYDYGTNVKVWYALDSFAYLLKQLGQAEKAVAYRQMAKELQDAIDRTMLQDGPFGVQISGGTNLGEEPGSFYLPEGRPYYDGEDTSSMLAPVYGVCDYTSTPWVNYHRFARSIWCANFDPEFGILRWGPGEFGVLDGTAAFSRLGGSVTPGEMAEALAVLRTIGVDDVTGSVFWWPRGVNMKRGLTRCSQGQGAWAWQYLEQWTGIRIDTGAHLFTVAPRGFLTKFEWTGFASGGNCFDVHWRETQDGTTLTVRNRNAVVWDIQAGFRPYGTGATAPLVWQSVRLEPGQSISLAQPPTPAAIDPTYEQAAITRLEAATFGDADGVVFQRYGPAKVWGHWDADLWFDTAAMPLTLRLLVQNVTPLDWRDVSVELVCPAGWQASARPPQQWNPPTTPKTTIRLDLGPLPSCGRTVAPFWLDGPLEVKGAPSWETLGRRDSFHMPSQPGSGLVLHKTAVDQPQEMEFEARLTATTVHGDQVARRLVIPVRFEPD